MRFDEIDNIWTVDLSALSNADRGRVYFERAKHVVREALSDPSERLQAVEGRRLRRSYLVNKIGCQPAVTTQNPKIKRLLVETDEQLASVLEQARGRERPTQGAQSSEVAELRSTIGKLKRPVDVRVAQIGLIINTDASCKIKGQFWPNIPTLVWQEGIDEAASDWFRALVVEYGVAPSSAREYAKVIRPFLRRCRQRGRAWQTVDDEFLILWREDLRRAQNVSIGRVNASLKTIFAFYRWAEETKRTRFQVGIYGEDELPDALRHVAFPISAKRSFSKGRHGRVYGGWTTPLTLSEPRRGGHVRHTPTEDEIRDLHQIVATSAHGERDSLMLSWAEEAGPRRAEILRVSRSHMPTSKQLAELIEKDEPWLIVVPRKGGKAKPLNVPPDLLIRTIDYIQFGRREIVDQCYGKIVGYREPDEVFLSGSTGLPLHPDTVTSIGRRTFRKAGIKRANIHRLRARFAVRTVDALVDAIFEGETVGPGSSWIETILVKAAEIMGHSDPQSLRPYLTYVLNRRLQTADAMKAEKLASRLRSLRLHEDTLVRRMERHQDLHRVADHIKAGRKAEAAKELRRIADALE